MFKKRGVPKRERGFFAKHKVLMAISMLIGTIVGAGVLAIPYVVAQSGFLIGFVDIVLVGVVFLFLHLFLGEIVLRTKKQYQLTGYAGKYLGKWGKRLMAFAMVFGIYGALIAYIMGEGVALQKIFGGNSILYSLIFFIIISLIIYKGVKATGKAEMVVIGLLFLVVILIGIFSIGEMDVTHLTTVHWSKFFLPYGVILFAFVGTAAIPELQEELGSQKKHMKKAILWGSIIPIVLYLVFAAIVVAIVGLENFELLQPNERIATVALSIYANPLLGLFANIFAALAMFTSALTLGLALKEMYQYDFGLSKGWSFALTMSIPLIIALSNITSFITAIGITGAIAGGIDGILVVLAFWKAKAMGDRKPEYSLPPLRIVGWSLITLFSVGILHQVVVSFF